MARPVVVLALILGFLPVSHRSPGAQAQQGQTGNSASLRNDEIVAMVGAGISEEAIVRTIQSAKARNFDLSPSGLIALKKAGVSDRIIAVMQDPNGTIARAAESSKVNRLPGVYIADGPSEQEEQTALTAASHDEGGNALGMLTMPWGGFGGKVTAKISGQRASLRVKSSPTIYAYGFENVDPVVVKLRVKGKRREIATARGNVFSGFGGFSKDDIVPITTERLEADIWRLTPTASLKPGEYAVFTPAKRMFYDFGVDQ